MDESDRGAQGLGPGRPGGRTPPAAAENPYRWGYSTVRGWSWACGGGRWAVVGVYVLVILVVLAVLGSLWGAGRRAAGASAVRRAQVRVGEALRTGTGDAGPAARVAALAAQVPAMPATEAAAVVLASRRAFSRDIIPVLVAGLAHRSAVVSQDAGRALADLGSPGLRAVWQALDGANQSGTALEAFLLGHPDWLFQCLLEGYVAGGEDSVRRHERLWRASGMVSRLALLRQGSDAVNALRAAAIAALLGSGGDRVA